MRQYLDMMRHVRDSGVRKDDRTGTGTLSVFGDLLGDELDPVAIGQPPGVVGLPESAAE